MDHPVGPGSPKVALVDGKIDNITFEQAAQWLVRVLRPPLTAVLSLISDDGPNASGANLTLIRSPKSAKSMRWGSPSVSPSRQSSVMSLATKSGADDEEVSERLFEMRHSELDEVHEQLADVLKVGPPIMARRSCQPSRTGP